MRDWLDDSRNRHDVVSVPTIWVAILLSLLVHVALMWWWFPNMRLPMLDKADQSPGQDSLQVRLTPPPSKPPAPPPAPAVRAQPAPVPETKPSPKAPPQPVPPRKAPPSPAMARAQPAPPVIALNRPAPAATPPAPIAPPAPAPMRTQPPGDGDLASYIEARRRARNDAAPHPSPGGSVAQAPPVEDDNARSKRIVAENLATGRAPTFGDDPSKSGGIFQIKRMSYEDAEFVFFGWNKDIRRNTSQRIEVQRGNNSDIRIAVVRRIIAIIREYEQEDFLWESKRLGRNLTLSARAQDNAGLESFLMREFFGDTRMTP
jgi:hypothetical protein